MGTTKRDIHWQKANELIDNEIEKLDNVDVLELVNSYVAVSPVEKALAETRAALVRAAELLSLADKELEAEQADEAKWTWFYRRAIQLAGEGEEDVRAVDALQVILDGDLLG